MRSSRVIVDVEAEKSPKSMTIYASFMKSFYKKKNQGNDGANALLYINKNLRNSI